MSEDDSYERWRAGFIREWNDYARAHATVVLDPNTFAADQPIAAPGITLSADHPVICVAFADGSHGIGRWRHTGWGGGSLLRIDFHRPYTKFVTVAVGFMDRAAAVLRAYDTKARILKEFVTPEFTEETHRIGVTRAHDLIATVLVGGAAEVPVYIGTVRYSTGLMPQALSDGVYLR